ncbi:MAG: tripartite tricarboxylate transporter substrate-binding protein, partial [Deltaproteobacteria bacterium]|nr:tripartite tricarboxylate transporter substrate-binding protein [Deltaproteobacteria bacterium]
MQIYSFSRILSWASRCLCALTLILISSAIAYSSSHEFYKGKNLRIVVGFPAGGGFDTYARALSRHLGKHIPGNPSVVVDNMPGAGSMIGANHVFKVAKPDGLTLGHFHGGLFLQQLIGRPGIEFDAAKFDFIGAPVTDKVACAITKAAGITNMESWLAAKTPVKLGATAPGTSGYDASRILEHALKFPIHLVSGYKGTADI